MLYTMSSCYLDPDGHFVTSITASHCTIGAKDENMTLLCHSSRKHTTGDTRCQIPKALPDLLFGKRADLSAAKKWCRGVAIIHERFRNEAVESYRID